MQVCTKCEGRGSREVKLSNGDTVEKGCYICGGNGFLEGDPAGTVVVPPKLKQKPIETPKPIQGTPVSQKRGILSTLLGDMSWLGSRRLTHG